MSFTVIIPARFGSKRLPGKPLLEINKKPLIQIVFEKAINSKAEKVYVASDHKKILDRCKEFGAAAVNTNSNHLTGTDRIAEVITKLNIKDESIIVNLQGDEPFIDPNDINNVAELLEDRDRINFNMGTLFTDLKVDEEDNPNVVKIWVNKNRKVKGFSRNKRLLNNQSLLMAKHLGIYSYRASFIKKFVNWDQTKNEVLENLEQLRALENNTSIGAIKALSVDSIGIDTKEDLIKARSMMLDE